MAVNIKEYMVPFINERKCFKLEVKEGVIVVNNKKIEHTVSTDKNNNLVFSKQGKDVFICKTFRQFFKKFFL